MADPGFLAVENRLVSDERAKRESRTKSTSLNTSSFEKYKKQERKMSKIVKYQDGFSCQ